ncbi:hypothetical protein GQX74_008852 [Glossina fuscipes]|nr:hypothetical protein GQX74_008852 [Glossina fuscipes]
MKWQESLHLQCACVYTCACVYLALLNRILFHYKRYMRRWPHTAASQKICHVQQDLIIVSVLFANVLMTFMQSVNFHVYAIVVVYCLGANCETGWRMDMGIGKASDGKGASAFQRWSAISANIGSNMYHIQVSLNNIPFGEVHALWLCELADLELECLKILRGTLMVVITATAVAVAAAACLLLLLPVPKQQQQQQQEQQKQLRIQYQTTQPVCWFNHKLDNAVKWQNGKQDWNTK